MTRFWCQASRMCAKTSSSISCLRSMPMIWAPSAADNGRKASAGARSLTSVWAYSIRPLHRCATTRCGGAALNYRPLGSRCSRLFRINEHEGDAAGLGPAIDPGVIGALLHEHIAGLEVNFRIVEQHVDLAGHYNGVVHCARAVHGGMPRRQAALGRTIAEALMHGSGVEISRLRRFRRKLDDAKHRSAAWRHDTDVDRRTVGAAGEVGRRLISHPQQARDGLRLRTHLFMRSGAVEQHHGLVVAVDRSD